MRETVCFAGSSETKSVSLAGYQESTSMLPNPIEKTRGAPASAASRPPGFRDGVQCSIERRSLQIGEFDHGATVRCLVGQCWNFQFILSGYHFIVSVLVLELL